MMMKLNLFEDGGLAGAGGSRENEASLSVQTASYCSNLSEMILVMMVVYDDYDQSCPSVKTAQLNTNHILLDRTQVLQLFATNIPTRTTSWNVPTFPDVLVPTDIIAINVSY